MKDAVSGLFQPMTEGVIAALFVVVSHSGFVTWWIDGSFGFDFDVCFVARTGAAALVFNVVRWVGSSAVITLGDVDFGVVTRTFNVNGSFRVTFVAGLTVAAQFVRTNTDI